jgi:hypothetical protein
MLKPTSISNDWFEFKPLSNISPPLGEVAFLVPSLERRHLITKRCNDVNLMQDAHKYSAIDPDAHTSAARRAVDTAAGVSDRRSKRAGNNSRCWKTPFERTFLNITTFFQYNFLVSAFCKVF